MRRPGGGALLAVAMLGGCATVPQVGGSLDDVYGALREQVSFDHGCPPARVRVLRRSDGAQAVDLDVCGEARRYKAFGHPAGWLTWLDVTSLYPAASLPQLAPMGPPAPRG